jgi:AraC family transcriptional regulator
MTPYVAVSPGKASAAVATEAPRALRRDTANESTALSHLRAVSCVLSEMRRDPARDIDLRVMAGIARMSRFHFLRVFSDVTRVSPGRFYAALRIERAKRLLLDTQLAVTTICFDVGYNSLGTFTRTFTEFVGLSPSAFRHLRRRLEECPLQSLVAMHVARAAADTGIAAIEGEIDSQCATGAPIFVGLFESAVPQRLPVMGTVLRSPGRFSLQGADAVAPSHLLAAAFASDAVETDYLAPRQQDLLVGSAVVSRRVGAERPTVRLTLRRCTEFDPPILIALPALLLHA